MCKSQKQGVREVEQLSNLEQVALFACCTLTGGASREEASDDSGRKQVNIELCARLSMRCQPLAERSPLWYSASYMERWEAGSAGSGVFLRLFGQAKGTCICCSSQSICSGPHSRYCFGLLSAVPRGRAHTLYYKSQARAYLRKEFAEQHIEPLLEELMRLLQ